MPILRRSVVQFCSAPLVRFHTALDKFQSAQDSVATAVQQSGSPVVIADCADGTTAGAGGDSTHLLRELVHKGIPGGALTMMVDPQAMDHARTVGEGGPFRFAVGGKRDNVFSQPLEVSGQVLSLRPCRFVLTGAGAENLFVDMGMSAAVRIGDVTLLLVEASGPGGTPMVYRCVGLEPTDFKIVVAKSPVSFRAEFEPFAAGIILADCPGCSSPRLSELPFKRITRPLWPFDEVEHWMTQLTPGME